MTLEALRASEGRYRLIVEASPAPMAVHRGGRLVYANAAAAQLVGAESAEALIGRPVLDFVHPDYREAVIARARRAQVEGQPSPTLEERFLTLDGRSIDVEVTAIPVPYEGEPASLVVIRDITRQKANEQADRRLALLAEASAALISSVERRDLLPAVLNLSGQLFDASGYAVWRSDASGSWRIEAASGLSESYMQSALAAFTSTQRTTAWTVAAGDVEREPALERNRAAHRAEGIRALLAVPLRIHGLDSGTITFYWREPRDFPDAELRAATALANLAGAALSTAELYEQQASLRAAAETERARMRFVADASAVLNSSLDYTATLQRTAALAVPRLADLCTVDVREADGVLRRVAVAYIDHQREQELRDIAAGYPPGWEVRHPVGEVVASGRPAVVSDAGPPGSKDDPALALSRAIHPRSYMIVPLVARDIILGALGLVTSVSTRRYTEDDLPLAEELARRAATAIERAQLYESTRAAEHRVRALAEASRSLAAASLSEQAVYQTLVEQATSTLGDACAVAIVSEDHDRLLVPAVYHADPDALGMLRSLLEALLTAQSWHETLAGRVAQTGEAIRRTGLSRSAVRELVPRELWPDASRFPIQSLMAVPLGVEGRTFGALLLSRFGHSPAYTEDDQAFAQDLADRAALAIDNAVLYRRAQQAIRARDEFLSIASHELRTPVTALKAVAQYLQRAQARGPLEPERLQRALKQMDEGSRRLAVLTEDLLDVSRLQTGRFELRPEVLDVGQLTGEFVERSAEQLEGRRVVVETEPGCVVQADPARLEQVLGNLLSNAALYSPDGGQIDVRVRRHEAGVLLEVEDRGIGLPPGANADMFQPFGRGANAASRQIQGLGLGLYICREIIERHNGRIWATSPGEGQGTTLHVWVPAT